MNDRNKRRWEHAKKHEFNAFNMILIAVVIALVVYTYYNP